MEAPLDLTLLTIDQISLYDVVHSEWLKEIFKIGQETNDFKPFEFLLGLYKVPKHILEKTETDEEIRTKYCVANCQGKQVALLFACCRMDDYIRSPSAVNIDVRNYTHIFVKKQYQNQGICTKVLQKLSETICEIQVNDRILKIIDKHNIKFLPFIKKNKDGTTRCVSLPMAEITKFV